MQEGPLGVPRPLLNIGCRTVVKHQFGGEQNAEKMDRVAQAYFPVRQMSVVYNQNLPASPELVLDQDRFDAQQLFSFHNDYADGIGESVDNVNLIFRAEPQTENRVPRPFFDANSTLDSRWAVEVRNISQSDARDPVELGEAVNRNSAAVESVSSLGDNSILVTLNSDSLSMAMLEDVVDPMMGRAVRSSDISLVCNVAER